MKNRRTTSQSSSASATPTPASCRHSLALYQFPQRGDQQVDLAFVVEDRQRDTEAVETVAHHRPAVDPVPFGQGLSHPEHIVTHKLDGGDAGREVVVRRRFDFESRVVSHCLAKIVFELVDSSLSPPRPHEILEIEGDSEAQDLGQVAGVVVLETANRLVLPATGDDQRFEQPLRLLPGIENADPLGCEEPLVGLSGLEVAAEVLQVDVKHSRRLGAVDRNQDAA